MNHQLFKKWSNSQHLCIRRLRQIKKISKRTRGKDKEEVNFKMTFHDMIYFISNNIVIFKVLYYNIFLYCVPNNFFLNLIVYSNGILFGTRLQQV